MNHNFKHTTLYVGEDWDIMKPNESEFETHDTFEEDWDGMKPFDFKSMVRCVPVQTGLPCQKL